MNSRLRHVGVVGAFVLAWPALADVKLHGLFTDNMVLQRGAVVPVWGWADEGEKVTVEFRNQKVSTTAKDGKWMVNLKRLKVGGPAELRVTGKNRIELKNVLVGEVWIASGQSNMEWPMRASYEPEKEIAKTRNPLLRLCTVPKTKADAPRDNVPASWQECNPSTTSNFSAVAYYFARDLAKALDVPVGVIHTSWGGSPVEVWMRKDVLAANARYKTEILDGYDAQAAKYKEELAKWEQEQADARKEGKEFKKRRPGGPWKPTELYNGMIAPLIPFAIGGAIWYQGESNAGRAHQYRSLFADMIRNWREDWGQGDFPFLLVQLAPFMAIKEQPVESAWAELREAQALATKTLPKVGMAVITDVGDERDIHPKKKEPVGARLALAARKIAYGQDVDYSGPTFKSMKVKEGKAILSFDHVGPGLEARGGELKGFAIAGPDKKFVWATAEIQGEKVVVSSAEVPEPIAVRYGWADYPVVNLWNKAGLPASPFRTDEFQMVTRK
ncbi:MAG: sialate O-acetylesterase [Verrucomicrobia subdivision 3 bacterium]|nr:sialate O-acetylesterase [Limisphaerales bacterium]